jgi:hypothetical protein
MANRTFFQDSGSLDKGLRHLYVEFVAGTSGAVPTTRTGYLHTNGIKNVTLASTGKYKVHLQDPYLSLADWDVNIEQVTYANTHGGMVTVAPADITVTDGTDPSIVFQVRSTDGNGTAVALTSGDMFSCHLTLRNL